VFYRYGTIDGICQAAQRGELRAGNFPKGVCNMFQDVGPAAQVSSPAPVAALGCSYHRWHLPAARSSGCCVQQHARTAGVPEDMRGAHLSMLQMCCTAGCGAAAAWLGVAIVGHRVW
jgi:hypothetical protein